MNTHRLIKKASYNWWIRLTPKQRTTLCKIYYPKRQVEFVATDSHSIINIYEKVVINVSYD